MRYVCLFNCTLAKITIWFNIWYYIAGRKCYLRLLYTCLHFYAIENINDRQIEWIELILEMTFFFFLSFFLVICTRVHYRILQNRDMFKEHVFQWNRSIINLCYCQFISTNLIHFLIIVCHIAFTLDSILGLVTKICDVMCFRPFHSVIFMFHCWLEFVIRSNYTEYNFNAVNFPFY